MNTGKPYLVSCGSDPVELRGRVCVRPALDGDWLSFADIHRCRKHAGRDVRQAAVSPTPRCHHFLELPSNQQRGGVAECDGRLQQREVRGVPQVRGPGMKAVAAKRVGVKRELLQRRHRGQQVRGQERERGAVEQERAQRRDATGDGTESQTGESEEMGQRDRQVRDR